MRYKWKPSAAQKRAFSEKMQDPAEQLAYESRKVERGNKRRSGSKFDYDTAGGSYIPTYDQYSFCMRNWPVDTTSDQNEARNMVIYGYNNKEKVHHDHIHIVNELRRANNIY